MAKAYIQVDFRDLEHHACESSEFIVRFTVIDKSRSVIHEASVVQW